MHNWRIETEGEQRIVVNRRRDGTIERFDNLCFHGGEGMTLEFRLFSRQGLIDSLRDAGLRIATIYDKPVEPHAISLGLNNFVLVAERPR